MRNRTAALVLALAVAIGGTSHAQPASQPTDYPALRKRLAELTEMVEKLSAQVRSLQTENADLKKQVADTKPAGAVEDGERRFNLGVGWEGPIGAARVVRVESPLAAVIDLHSKDGADLGRVWIADYDTSNLADNQEFADSTIIKVEKTVEIRGTIYLLARPVKSPTSR